MFASLNRREALYGMGNGLGAVALASLTGRANAGPAAAKNPHHPARAKAVIQLFMEGGPSHIDTFDPKPALAARHMEVFQRKEKFASAMSSGKRYFVQSPYGFTRHGQSGLAMSDQWRHLPTVADELCVYHGLQAESVNHPTACYHINTGGRFGGEPAMGSWVTYGLGTENEDLPAFVVLPERSFPQGGAANWSNAYLPAHFQGTTLRSGGSPILDLTPPAGVARSTQRRNLDLLAELNRLDAERHPHEAALAARAESYELAYRMQTEVPAALDIGGETAETLSMYGVDEPDTDEFGRKCLLARKLVESGVRFVQVYSSGWDSHDYLEKSHAARIRTVDKPFAGLVADLRRRGLLDDTLVIWGGEFGRSPDNGIRGGRQAAGRDHNAKAMVSVMAGGGVKAGHRVGATDEIGDAAIEVARPLKDWHVTMLHLLGLNDADLTFFHDGRFKQLSQVGGSVIDELLA